MFLNDFYKIEENKKLNKLIKSLKIDHGVDVVVYESLSTDELVLFLEDLHEKKIQIIKESDFGAYYQDPEYTRTVLLEKVIRMILKEIQPKRLRKKKVKESTNNEIEETLDYKVHPPTGAAVDHDIDEDKERPDLYWRKHQWEEERTQENHPVEVRDAPPAGEAYNLDWKTNNPVPEETEKFDAYAQNAQPVGGTHENEQQAGVYVAVMNPDRFLGDKDINIMSIKPPIKSENELSPLTREVSKVMVDVRDMQKDEEMTRESAIKGLGDLLESSLLNEGELERAEIVMQISDIIVSMDRMIEDLAKKSTDDILPMVDVIKQNFGSSEAESFTQQIEQLLQQAADSIVNVKDVLTKSAENYQARISDEDVQQPITDMTSGMMGAEEPMGDLGAELGAELAPEMGAEEPGDVGDLLGGEETNASEEPLGRAKKESRIVNLAGKKVKLTMEQIYTLANAKKITEKVRALEEAAKYTVESRTAVLTIKGSRIRITEEQLKSLLFAKNWKKLVESKNASVVRLSKSQAEKLIQAKRLTEKVNELLEKCGPEAKRTKKMNEKKPSAGLSKKKKSALVKKAKKGGDIGKKGKGFKKVAAAAKKGGAKDPEAVAAAAMWKNASR